MNLCHNLRSNNYCTQFFTEYLQLCKYGTHQEGHRTACSQVQGHGKCASPLGQEHQESHQRQVEDIETEE